MTTSAHPKLEQGGKLKGVHVLIILLLFFGTVIAVNIAFIVAAVKTFTGADEHSWVEGLRFNQTLDARARQHALGWTMQLKVNRPVDASTQFDVVMADKAGAPLTDLRVNMVLQRAKQPDVALVCVAVPTQAGTYACPGQQLRHGRWLALIDARHGTGTNIEPFHAEADLVIQ